MSDISSKAMLVFLNISTWSARRFDEKATQEVADNHGTTADAGRYNKCVIDPKAPSLKRLQQAADAARKFHYAHTLPWAKSGAQILPAGEFFEYTTEMAKLKRAFDDAVEEFVRDYPTLKELARASLNGLFNERDYPMKNDLRSRYGFAIDYMPVPADSDWRVSIGADEEAKIKANIRAELERASKQATQEIAQRLLEPVQRMAEKLSQPDAIFKDSLVNNLREICDLVPRLNFTGDLVLENARREIAEQLASFGPQTLRDDKVKRAEAAKRANDIARKMAAFMGAQQ